MNRNISQNFYDEISDRKRISKFKNKKDKIKAKNNEYY